MVQTNKNIYTVGQVNSYIKRNFEDDFVLKNIFIKGEISNCKYHFSGHIYFSLKDETGVLSAVMFKSSASKLKMRLTDGMKVVAQGHIGVYERDGKYQLYASEIFNSGTGDLYKEFEELKKRLSESGMFSSEYKKKIPAFSMNIGVVTAETGAVINDIFNVASRRNPYCKITLYPSKVQGDGAKESICKGIETLDKLNLDCIIIGRGGGSIEDLWAFNEEIVARAIFNCSTPVISAVGHETDFTIADYVADLRAPTPSAAAELAVFEYSRFLSDLDSYKFTLKNYMNNKLKSLNETARRYGLNMEVLSPKGKLVQNIQNSDDYLNKINNLINAKLHKDSKTLVMLSERLNGLSPLKRLSEGYSFVEDKSGNCIKSVDQVNKGDNIYISLTDGQLSAEVISKESIKR